MAVEKITDEQITEWKKKHGEVFYFESEDGSWCCLFKPSRTTLDAFFANSKTPIKAVQTVIVNSWIGGDETFKTDEYKILAIADKIDDLLEVKKTTLKKL